MPATATFCGAEEWGPADPSRVDLTQCAENSIVLVLPALLATVFFLLEISRIVFSSKAQPHKLGLTWTIYVPCQLCMLGACLSLVTRAILIAQESSEWAIATMFSTISMIVAWGIGIILNHLQHCYTIRSNNALALYYITTIAGAAITIRTLHDTNQTHLGSFKAFCAYFAFVFLGLVVEAWPRGRTAVQKKSHASAYEKANLISRLWFHYIQQIVAIGYRRPLQIDDIQGMLPQRARTENSYGTLAQAWAKHVEDCRTNQREPWLMRLILRTYAWNITLAVALQLSGLAMAYVTPQLINQLLKFSESYKTATPEPVSLGWILAFSMLFSNTISALLEAQFQLMIGSVGIEARTALVSMIYRKSLKLSTDARQQSTAGEIFNHMSVDAECFWKVMPFLPYLISIPFEICIATWLLYRQMGWCAIVGVSTLLLIAPLQVLISAKFSKAKAGILAAMDSRIRLMNEVLAGIKIVKLYGWEDSFRQKIDVYRKKELAILKKMGVAYSFMTIMFSSATMFMALTSFSLYAAFGPGTINSQIVFVSITVLNMLNRPLGYLSNTLTNAISLMVSARRIQQFLLLEELDENWIERSDDLPTDGQPVIQVRDGTFAWGKKSPKCNSGLEHSIRAGVAANTDRNQLQEARENQSVDSDRSQLESRANEPVLKDIQLSVGAGELAIIVGRVAQGKSSLLSCLIGDMYVRQGSIKVSGRVAYVPQQAWVINATLKDNIVFGMALDQDKYERIVSACGLLPDLEVLPAGDMTEIGEQGINLSGGQKQRVSLARAAYRDADIYLLDDPSSAVDAHVDKHLWDNLIGPNGMLKDKTRVLVTHGIHHLSEADQIIALKDGKIDENGQYEELLRTGGTLFRLVEDYSVKEESESKDGLGVQAADFDATSAQLCKVGIVGDSKQVKDGKLIGEETMKNGAITWSIYRMYCKAASYHNVAIVVGILVLRHVCQFGANFWLKHWVVAVNDTLHTYRYFMGIYSALVVAYMVTVASSCWTAIAVAGVRASKNVHNALLDNILRLPMSFFDTTPLGRIVNRFASDIVGIGETIPWQFHATAACIMSVIASLLVISLSTPIFLSVLPPLTAIYAYVEIYYIGSSRTLRRIRSITRSPLYQHFSETLSGASSLRAMRCQEQFIAENATRADQSSNAEFLCLVALRWLGTRLKAISSIVVFSAAAFAVIDRKNLDPSTVGLSLSYAVGVTENIVWIVQCFCNLQDELIALERIEQYTSEPQEAPARTNIQLPDNWPEQGHIAFKNYSTRYRAGMDLVLKDISFEIQPGEKVGIVGRTGAGKSSLTLALFRIIEAANSPWVMGMRNQSSSTVDSSDSIVDEMPEKALEKVFVDRDGGSIWIDGVDISKVGLKYLRQHLAIIPQEPTLFAGTVRHNLDPFDEHDDTQIWEALERSHLKEYIASVPGALMYEVVQNGENFSVGQRSMICLARALLRKTKILVLDEATSSVDMQTDELIQRTIRTEFQDRTILTIAHRIKTVMDYDKILVLDQGRVAEFEPPSTLLQNKNSLFYQLALQAGEVAT